MGMPGRAMDRRVNTDGHEIAVLPSGTGPVNRPRSIVYPCCADRESWPSIRQRHSGPMWCLHQSFTATGVAVRCLSRSAQTLRRTATSVDVLSGRVTPPPSPVTAVSASDSDGTELAGALSFCLPPMRFVDDAGRCPSSTCRLSFTSIPDHCCSSRYFPELLVIVVVLLGMSCMMGLSQADPDRRERHPCGLQWPDGDLAQPRRASVSRLPNGATISTRSSARAWHRAQVVETLMLEVEADEVLVVMLTSYHRRHCDGRSVRVRGCGFA